MSELQEYARPLTAEFLGTMGLIIAAIGSIGLAQSWLESTHIDQPWVYVFINAVAVGFILFALIEALGPISGAHFNPAVTIAMLFSKDIEPKKAVMYIIAQILGAIVGVLLVNLTFMDMSLGGEILYISENSSRDTWSILLSEFICTFMLLMIIYCCSRNGSSKTSLAVGLFVGGMIVTTTATMFANPAVDFARMFTNFACGIAPLNALEFMIMDILAGIVAAFVFRWLVPKKS